MRRMRIGRGWLDKSSRPRLRKIYYFSPHQLPTGLPLLSSYGSFSRDKQFRPLFCWQASRHTHRRGSTTGQSDAQHARQNSTEFSDLGHYRQTALFSEIITKYRPGNRTSNFSTVPPKCQSRPHFQAYIPLREGQADSFRGVGHPPLLSRQWEGLDWRLSGASRVRQRFGLAVPATCSVLLLVWGFLPLTRFRSTR